uniref:Thioredoxin-related protein n=1 Tax=Marseillevirus LCMAC103 TaxID=2506604 RepID=A0A481YUT2_9VIRU|nr:MAG: thioredoxin-related protein [Marseillevirus LCMAC103]
MTTRLLLLAALLFAGAALFLTYRASGRTDSKAVLCFSAAAVLLAAVLWAQTGEPFEPKAAAPDAAEAHGVSVVTLSADSWCPYCKQMSAQVQELHAALQSKGCAFRLVSDTADKEEFDDLSKAYGARAFPHTVVFKGGQKIAEIPGYMPVDAFVAKIEAYAG